MTLWSRQRDASGGDSGTRGKPGEETRPRTGTATGGWRRNGRTVRWREAGRPERQSGRCSCAGRPGRPGCRPVRRAGRPGVRAPIVARKPGNAGRAKGCRKVDDGTSGSTRWTISVPISAILIGVGRAHVTRLGVSIRVSFMLTVPKGRKARLYRPRVLLLPRACVSISQSCFR